MVKKSKPLTPKEERFAVAYVASGDAQASSIEAGYGCKDKRNHADNGCIVRTRPHVLLRIKELQANESKRAMITIADTASHIKRVP